VSHTLKNKSQSFSDIITRFSFHFDVKHIILLKVMFGKIGNKIDFLKSRSVLEGSKLAYGEKIRPRIGSISCRKGTGNTSKRFRVE